jgi:hypothetical protein
MKNLFAVVAMLFCPAVFAQQSEAISLASPEVSVTFYYPSTVGIFNDNGYPMHATVTDNYFSDDRFTGTATVVPTHSSKLGFSNCSDAQVTSPMYDGAGNAAQYGELWVCHAYNTRYGWHFSWTADTGTMSIN